MGDSPSRDARFPLCRAISCCRDGGGEKGPSYTDMGALGTEVGILKEARRD